MRVIINSHTEVQVGMRAPLHPSSAQAPSAWLLRHPWVLLRSAGSEMAHHRDCIYASRKEEREKDGHAFPFKGKTWKLHTHLC